MDDQLARANVAGRNKSMLVLDEPVMADLEESIAKMLDPEFRSQLKAKCAEDSQSNGAEDSAKFILKMIDES